MITVSNYIDHFIKIWENSSSQFPVFNRFYDEAEKLEREKNFEQIQEKMKAFQSRSAVRKLRNSNPESKFFPVFKSFLHDIFDFEQAHLEIILSEEFRNVSKDFFYQAREFAPELSPENIYQGLRNVWIMNGLQLMMNIPVEITPSIFAYSMIYPYSDNLLDDPNISDSEKQEFSIRFNKRLHGENVTPLNHTESQLFQLVGMFEEQYNRFQFPEVYESLYAIQKGQTDSLKLLKQSGLTETEIRRVCFEKGGTSVLADGYLVAGKLSLSQEQALIGYGIYLQLLDDIQDIKEDATALTNTMCTSLEKSDLDEFVNRTVHFGRTALEEMKCFEAPNVDVFLNLMNRSIETMIIESIGLNETGFTENYLVEIEKSSPLHFDFIRRKKSESKSQRFAMFKKYFEQVKPEQITKLSYF
ncbi:MAG TPA: class 1 isoprenoid biosynthesis enzyme [Draconibacterium sp.]|nr:class 1 isoprenoid biosynthesis enzyme [Draconibacterium sp.]HRX12454.1 class 1 isoprenoid biosynthesis enzyme [Draconibacterium sp.]